MSDVCYYCGQPFGNDPEQRRTKDHVLPKLFFVGTTRANYVDACRSCNTAKGSRTPSDMRSLADMLDRNAARFRDMADKVDALIVERRLVAPASSASGNSPASGVGEPSSLC